MRLPTRHDSDRRRLDVKMTPMIDVVFLLLIFFVCTASFQTIEEYLPTNLSMAKGSGTPLEPLNPVIEELEPIIVRVIWNDDRVHWRVGEGDYQRLEDVRAALKLLAEIQSQLPVILDIDDEVPVGDVVQIHDICRLTGFTRVQFAVSAP